MIPIIDDFVLRFNIKDFVVVADSGLLNKTNVDLLRQAGYKYILGARIKKEPIFHFTEKRIEAHICICFIAYKVYKELQRIIALHGGINLSVDKVIDIAKTIPTIKLSLPYGDTERVKTLFLTEKHQRIKPLFDIKAILDKKQD